MKKVFIGTNIVFITSFVTKNAFSIKKIKDDSFEPLIKKDSYVLINKWYKKQKNDGFFFYYDEKSNSEKISFKIGDEKSWILNKNLRTLIKIPQNFIAHSNYKNNDDNFVVNKAFVIGYPIFIINELNPVKNIIVDTKKFNLEKTDY